jgi:hypothetical protein
MNEKNTAKLYKDFPKLYEGRTKSLQESLMPFGFMCGDGWFGLVYDLSKKISKLEPSVRAVEVKEKWGGLRFYIISGRKEVFDMISKAEEQSYHVCEVCGKIGKLRDDLGWIRTLCLKHYKEAKR